MKKDELVTELATRTGTTKVAACAALEALASIARDELIGNHEFQYPGLVKMTVVKAAARNSRNPATGEAIVVPEKMKVRVKALHPINSLKFML